MCVVQYINIINVIQFSNQVVCKIDLDKYIVIIIYQMSETKLQKPFIKWVGGKTQIIDKIMSKIPTEMENYHELFLGGGSVLLAVLSLQKAGKIIIKGNIYAYDLNKQLIQVYRHIQTKKDDLFKWIEKYKNEYSKCPDVEKGTANRDPKNITEATTSKESYYYWMRKKFNKLTYLSVKNSALFILINKLCFRGVYREGPNGFNVPFGHYKKMPEIITKEKLDAISALIKDVIFIGADFEESIQNVTENDFVYLDPPYAPENATSFVGYTKDGFNIDMHKKLFKLTKELSNNQVKFAMSNAKVELITENFKEYKIEDVPARRAINSKNPAACTTEVIIYN
jgi:DNA adenine methylase